MQEIDYPDVIRDTKSAEVLDFRVFSVTKDKDGVPNSYTVCHNKSRCLIQVNFQTPEDTDDIQGVSEEALLLILLDRLRARTNQNARLSFKQASVHVRAAMEYLVNPDFQTDDTSKNAG